MDKPTIRKYGANGILMEWEPKISPEINDHVVRMAKYLEKEYAESIVEIVPSYHSLVVFIKNRLDLYRYIDIFRNVDIPISSYSTISKNRTWKIPVCYHLTLGLDFDTLSGKLNLSVEEIIELHTEPRYRIYGMGFLPGFLYLGGLNPQLHFPRKDKIKQLVPKGSVAIGGEQTGIYPQNSPGGWHLIGKTPIDLFDVKNEPPAPFSVGDSIQFSSISLEEFEEIEDQISNGRFQLKPLNDD